MDALFPLFSYWAGLLIGGGFVYLSFSRKQSNCKKNHYIAYHMKEGVGYEVKAFLEKETGEYLIISNLPLEEVKKLKNFFAE